MIKAVKKDTGDVVYMRLMKHYCPVCQERLRVVRIVKTVKSNTREARSFDFSACNASLGEKAKFIWYEFKCRKCNLRFTESAIRSIEKKKKALAKRAASTNYRKQ